MLAFSAGTESRLNRLIACSSVCARSTLTKSSFLLVSSRSTSMLLRKDASDASCAAGRQAEHQWCACRSGVWAQSELTNRVSWFRVHLSVGNKLAAHSLGRAVRNIQKQGCENTKARRVKTVLLRRHLHLKTNILPRQARDKHRESSTQKREWRFPLGRVCAIVRGLHLLRRYQRHHRRRGCSPPPHETSSQPPQPCPCRALERLDELICETNTIALKIKYLLMRLY